MNKNFECSSPAESDDDDDDDYVNTKDLEYRPTSKQSADNDESDDDGNDYVNTEELYRCPVTKQNSDVSAHTELKVIQRAPASSNGRLKILLMILVLLLLGSFAALCALMNLYLGNVASFHTLHEEYGNATGIMKVQEHEAADIKSRLDQVQKSFDKISEQLNTSKVEMRNCEMKYQQMEELLSEKQDLGNVASFHTLHEQYINATAIMKVQEHEAAYIKSRLDQVQMSFERISEQLNTSKVKMRHCEMKYQQMEELLSKKQVICEEGWRSLGLKRYFFSDDKLNWMESRDSCVKKGADLVIITSKKEQDFLSSLAKETHWIGLNDRETEGKWMWVNKQTLEETGVTFWYQRTQGKSEPDNWKIEDPNGENCASLGDSSGNIHKWFDGSCNKNKRYICEK